MCFIFSNWIMMSLGVFFFVETILLKIWVIFSSFRESWGLLGQVVNLRAAQVDLSEWPGQALSATQLQGWKVLFPKAWISWGYQVNAWGYSAHSVPFLARTPKSPGPRKPLELLCDSLPPCDRSCSAHLPLLFGPDIRAPPCRMWCFLLMQLLLSHRPVPQNPSCITGTKLQSLFSARWGHCLSGSATMGNRANMEGVVPSVVSLKDPITSFTAAPCLKTVSSHIYWWGRGRLVSVTLRWLGTKVSRDFENKW